MEESYPSAEMQSVYFRDSVQWAVMNYVSSVVRAEFEGVNILLRVFAPKKSEIYTRHIIANRIQQTGEILDQYFQVLHVLVKDCKFEDVNARVYKEEAIKDAFISGVSTSSLIRLTWN